MLYQDGEFYFIEMNTRLQVEHPVTELVTGIDLVKAQISVADGEPLALEQSDVRFNGHAIECRINAEDPKSLLPTPGAVQTYHPPGGPGVRVDSALYAGAIVPPFYDSLIAKLVVHDHDRATPAWRGLRRALGEYVIAGLPTNLPLLQAVVEQDGVRERRLPHRLAGRVPGRLAGARLIDAGACRQVRRPVSQEHAGPLARAAAMRLCQRGVPDGERPLRSDHPLDRAQAPRHPAARGASTSRRACAR